MMQLVGGRAPWMYTLIFNLLQLWGRLSASSSSPALPPPTLDIYTRSEDKVVLVCRVPEGYKGYFFLLYHARDEVDSQNVQSGQREVYFTVTAKEADNDEQELYCCLYRNQQGVYSEFSPYLQLEHQNDAAPTHTSLPPPVLSVEPSSGSVKRGDTLSFSCTVPTHVPQPQSNKPVTFLLMRTTRAGGASVVLPPPASQVSGPEPQPGVFRLGPVGGGEEGDYTCFYQVSKKRRTLNSTASNMVKVSVTDQLPVPTLVLQQQTDVWHLLCSGSPSYPGALFSLHLANNELPVDTQRVTPIQHQATFPVPVQETPVASYQCQYSVLLGGKWSHSEPSLPLAVTKVSGTPPPSSQGADWPLILGSFSTAVLFFSSLILVVVIAHRKFKAAAEEKKKRQEAQFWTQVHARDHVVDLTLRRSSFASQEWTSGNPETASRSPLWGSLSTFSSPVH